MSNPDPDLAITLRRRRHQLANLINFPALLWSGQACPRNFPANALPFRASSHFLYFAGLPLVNAAVYLDSGRLTLFMDNAPPEDALWHGPSPPREAIAHQMGADAAYSLVALPEKIQDAATIPVQDVHTRSQQSQLLGRTWPAAHTLTGIDWQLAQAIVSLRLIHDPGAIAQLQRAADVTVKAHRAGIAATRTATTEADIRAAMEAVLMAHHCPCAYASIVTTAGEVLHNCVYHHPLQGGNLLLADVGGETELGWAADVTRTWPVSGQFSPTQRDIYEVVLAAHDACINQIAPGVEYRNIHGLAAQVLTEGLISLGILRGNPADLLAREAHALFFPHGVGHLVGLDVHDMEDLGDLAGYAPGRVRSDRFGLCFLRLDRPLQSGMLVTIEPGFYQVEALLQDPDRRSQYADCVNWDRLSQFADVRGIRIEDDVLVTEQGGQVLTTGLPTGVAAIQDCLS